MLCCLRYMATNMTYVCLLILILVILSFMDIGDFKPRFYFQQSTMKDPVPGRIDIIDFGDEINFKNDHTTETTTMDIKIETSEGLFEGTINQYTEDDFNEISSISTRSKSSDIMISKISMNYDSTTINPIRFSEKTTTSKQASHKQTQDDQTSPSQSLPKESTPGQIISIETSSYPTFQENNSSDQTILQEKSPGGSLRMGDISGLITEEEPWVSATVARLSERRRVLKEGCNKHREDLGRSGVSSIRRTLKKRVYFANNLVTCLIAKVGTTTWKTHLLALAGVDVNLDVSAGRFGVHSPKTKKYIIAKRKLTAEQLDELMILESSYNQRESKLSSSTSPSTTPDTEPSTTEKDASPGSDDGDHSALEDIMRVLTVRPPLERLVSAYREKFLGGEKFILGEDHYNYINFHRPLLRNNNITANIGDVISFSFTQYLTHITYKEGNGNTHWRSYVMTCSPCHLAYDHVLHLDTFDDDLRYIYQQVGIEPDSDPYLGAVVHKTEGSAPPPNLDHFFKNQPEHLLRSLYKIYRMDFILFGYHIPKYLMKFEKEYVNHRK